MSTAVAAFDEVIRTLEHRDAGVPFDAHDVQAFADREARERFAAGRAARHVDRRPRQLTGKRVNTERTLMPAGVAAGLERLGRTLARHHQIDYRQHPAFSRKRHAPSDSGHLLVGTIRSKWGHW